MEGAQQGNQRNQKQEGRQFIGILKSARYTEKFAGAISVDGKSMAFVDEDGLLDGKIINNNLSMSSLNEEASEKIKKVMNYILNGYMSP